MKLASIQKIENITPIEGADAIETAHVLGWQVVVKKGEFQIGEYCTYIQIDTVVPEIEEFEFLRQRNFRVRTIKLRKQISQGLIVPLPIGGWKIGDDVTDVIGVKKFEKPDNNPVYEKPREPKGFWKKVWYRFKFNCLYKIFPQLRKKTRSPFPKNLVPITDEERIQNIPQVLAKHAGDFFYRTYKLDGSSITIIHNKFLGKSSFRICSRKFELHDTSNDWYRVFEQTNFKKHILALVEHFNTNDIIVQGEAIGKFNGNHHGLTKDEIRLFNIFVNGKRLRPEEFHRTAYTLDIPICPLESIALLPDNIATIMKDSEIKDILNPRVDAEGLVWRHVDSDLSFKAINNKYLLKTEQ